MTKIVLWDIDGTLIDGGGVIATALRTALSQVYGHIQTTVAFAGKTDQQIILETYPTRSANALFASLERFAATYIAELQQHEHDILLHGQVLDGVFPVFQALAAHTVVQSVLTGNLATIAEYKLYLFGLASYLDLAIGAYGSDHHNRTELVSIALSRAAHHYSYDYAVCDVVLIGDTPNDIACGRAARVRTVAVATGAWSVPELQACGADVVLPDLRDTAAVVDAILGKPESEYEP